MNARTVTPYYIFAALAVLLLVTALVYVPGLGGPPLLDDKSVVLPLMDLDRDTWREWLVNELVSDRGHLGRPVPMATFLANVIFHGHEMRYWNATNVFLHLCTGVLVFLLTCRLAGHFRKDGNTTACGWVALLVAGIWLLHPLQVSTVLYTVQRMAQIPALFIFAGLLAYTAGRQRQLAHSPGGWPLIGLAFLVLFPLALFSKENGVLFPVFTLLIEIFVFRFAGSVQSRRALIALYCLVLLLPAITGIVYLLINYETAVMPGYESRDFTLSERVITQFRVLVYYLYLLISPVQRNMGFFHDDFPVSHGFLDPPGTLFAVLLVTVLIVGALLARKKAALPAFGVLFFFMAHSLEASVFPLELFFEHRNYLPAFGIALCCVAVLQAVLRDKRMFVIAGASILVVLGSLTAIRADTWGSFEKFYNHAYRAHPDSRRVNIIFANNYADAGRFDEALQILNKFDSAGFTLNRLYVKCQRDGQLTGQDFITATNGLQGIVGHHAVNSFIHLANAGLDGKCAFSGQSLSGLVDAIFRQPFTSRDKSKILMYEAHFQHRDQELEAALDTLRDAFRHEPATPVALLLGTEWLLDAGEQARARSWYAEALAVVATSRHDFSEYTQGIEARLGKSGP